MSKAAQVLNVAQPVVENEMKIKMRKILKMCILTLATAAITSCLFSASTGRAFADVSLASTDVSYTASRRVSHTGSLGQIDFDVNATVQCNTNYSCSTDGVLPPSSTCHLNVAPKSGTLTVVYHIHRPILRDIDGSKSIPLPLGGQELLGDSPPIAIPIDSYGTITIVIHGRLSASLSVENGSVNPNSLEWSRWGTNDTVVSSSMNKVTLTLDTVYKIYFTVSVSISGFDVARRDSDPGQFSGSPSPAFVVSEYPSFIVPPLFLAVTLVTVIIYGRKKIHHDTTYGTHAFPSKIQGNTT